MPWSFVVECIWNMMAHAQKPDFVFRWNGQVHLNRRGCQFSQLLAAEVCASVLVMLDTPRSEVVWEYWLPTPFASFPFTSPPVHHRVPSGFKCTQNNFVMSFKAYIKTQLRFTCSMLFMLHIQSSTTDPNLTNLFHSNLVL